MNTLALDYSESLLQTGKQDQSIIKKKACEKAKNPQSRASVLFDLIGKRLLAYVRASKST